MARFIINQFRDNALHLFKQQTYLNCQIFQLHTGSISQRFWSLLRFSGLDNKTNPRPKKCVENRPQLPKYAYIKNDIALPIILQFSPKLSNKHATVESKANHFTELSLKSPNPFDTISEIFKDKKPSNPWSPPDVPNIPDPCGQSCGKSPSCPPPCPTPCPPQKPVCPPEPCPPAPCPPPSCPSQNPCNNVYEGKAKTFFKKRSINFYTGSYWKSDSDLSLNKFYTIKSGFSTNEPTSLSKNVKSTKVARNWSSFIKDPDMNALEEGRALVKNQDAQKTVYQGPNSDKDSDKNRSFLMYADRKKQKKKNTSKAKDRNKHKKNIKVKKDLNNWQTSLNKQSKDQWKSSEDPKSSNVKTPWEPPRRFYSQYLTKRNPTLENSNLLITPIRSINSNKCLLKDDRKKKMEREKQETIKREMKEIEDCIVNVKCGKQKKKKDDDKLKKGNK